MGLYIHPEYLTKRFTCPYCGTLAEMKWAKTYVYKSNFKQVQIDVRNNLAGEMKNEIGISLCNACEKTHIWCDRTMVIPENTGVVMPSEDMPENVKKIYNEAMEVYPKSSKAAAALLRLALQLLCKELGYEGKNINYDISKMVENGLPKRVQQVFDIIRVTGNEAVHPGTIDFDDNVDIALKLFEMLNFIIDKMITDPKEIDILYANLPPDKLAAIDKRDR